MPRILLIAPKFYDIDKKIALALTGHGYEVELIENKDLPFDYHAVRSKLRILRRLYFFIFTPQIMYIRKQFKKIADKKFDVLFSVNGHIISSFFMKRLKKANPGIYSVLYLWDSSYMYFWKNEARLFDKVYTFDILDSELYGFEYKPNFFIKERTQDSTECRNDLFFAGKFTPERLRVLDSILRLAKEGGLVSNFKLWTAYKNLIHNRWIYISLKKTGMETSWIRNYLLNYEIVEGIVHRDYLISERIKFDDIQKEFSASNVILDIPFNSQAGYTHRLIEALAGGKKILTSNRQLIKESFFNKDQIRFFDPDNVLIDIKWIKEKVKFSQESFISNLELSVWLKSILSSRNV